MNHIYKVIWNKAKHCYTVVSEIAKSHSQSNKRVRSMTAVVAAAMMLTGFGGMAIEAANPANEDVNIAVGKGASTNTTMGNPPGVVSGYIAIGENAYAWNGGNPDGIGRKESYLDFNQGAVSPNSLFTKAKVTDGTKLAGAIAIGKNTMARTGSVMIGDHTYKGQLGDIEVDPSKKMELNNGVYSTTLGTSSYNGGSMATVTGAFSIISNNGSSTLYGAQNFGATIYGSLNSIESSKSSGLWTGTGLVAGNANSVLGFGNRTQNTNASLVWGTGNEVTNSIENLKINNPYWHDVSASGAQQQIIDAMRSDQYAGGSVMAIGGGNKADWATYSQLLGVQNTLIGENGAVSKYDMINGYKNEVTNATHTSIIGSNNKAKNIQSTTVMGDNNDLTGNGNHVIGDNHKVTGKNNILIGNNKEQKTHSGSDSVIIGNNASAGNGSMVMGNEAHAGNTGIALGMKASAGDGQNLAIGYYANVSGATNSTALGYASKVEKRDILSSDGEDGVISVGKSVGQSGEAGITRRIINVKAGVNDTDAVNVSQLKGVKAEALKHSTVTNGDANITVTEGLNKDGGKEYKVALNNDITLAGDDPDAFVSISGSKGTIWTSGSVTAGSVAVGTAKADGTTPFFVDSNGAFYAADGKFSVDKDGSVKATSGDIGNVKLNDGVFYKNSALRDGELYVGDADGNYSQITSKNAKLGKVMIDDTGRISGVAAGRIAADSTDAINGSQLHAVQQEAGKHTKVVNGSNITVEETDQDGQKTYKVGLNKDLLLGDITGKNVSISGTHGTIETTGFIATKDKIYADKGAKLADVNVTGDTISNDKSSVKLDKEGTVTINNRVTIDQSGKISGVAAGEISSTSTDAVNGSQLHAVQQEAGKHTKVVNGSNITVEETDQDGQKTYKVGLNKDLLLGDITGKNVSISGTHGTIETTGFIATKDKIYADKGAKLADVNVTGDTISNDKSSVKLDKDGTVTINNKVTVDQNGKVSGVAAGEVKEGSTDAVNGSQLKGVENKADENAKNIQKNAEAISKNTEAIENNSKAIAENAKNIQKNTKDISKNTEAIGNLDKRVTNVEEVAKKHTTVSTDDTNVQISEDTNKDGGKDYKVSLNKDLNLSSVTTGDTKMDTNGVTVKDVSLTKDGLSIGNKTYVSNKGLNANDQKVTNVAAGDISEKSSDAVNGSQLFATNQQVAQNVQSISKLGNRINKVGAGAAALAALHPLDFDPDDKWDFAAGYGNYNGENAAAVGAYYRPNEDTMFSVGGSFGNGENMVNAGVSLKLGQGNHVSTSKVAMAKEIKDLRKEMEGLKSALLDANAGKKLDTSKLQLFPDVPKNHWAYEYVSTLKGNGVLTGYPDGEFKGDRPMTRYEFATMLYKAMLEGATLSDKILKEFAPELERFTVDTVHQDKDGKPTVERVRTVKAAK